MKRMEEMNTQIKVTPKQLEQAAKTVKNTKSSLEYLHKDLYSQTEYIVSIRCLMKQSQ